MTKSSGDADGWKRGECGVDREDNSEWFRTFDPKADRLMYGKMGVGMFATSDNPRVVNKGDDAA
jgi:hypothetical protein